MLVEMHNVSWRHAGQTLVDNITLGVKPGEIVTVIGPNGAGKSSLLKLAIGLAAPSSGSISRKPGLRIGYMPQRLAFDNNLPITVERFLRINKATAQTRAESSRKLRIEPILKQQLQSLSGGELQRVLLARAILTAPDLLVLDEPTQGVDVSGQVELYRQIAELRDDLGCGVLMVSHDLHLVMAQTDSVICLNKHICCHGTPESVESHPEYLQLFGRNAGREIAVYTHHHDHQHDMHGDVVHSNCGHKHD